jgi:hypothetical protein
VDEALDLPESDRDVTVARPRPREYFSLFGHAVANAADIAMLVIGTGLVSLAIAVLLDGFELASLALTDGTGAMLGSALVIGVFGAFALGVAAEGPIGHKSYAWLYATTPVIALRLVAVFVVGVLAFALAGVLPRFLDDLPTVFDWVVDIVRAAGLAGMTAVPLIGVPVSAGLRYFYGSETWVEELELPLLYIVWLAASMIYVF